LADTAYDVEFVDSNGNVEPVPPSEEAANIERRRQIGLPPEPPVWTPELGEIRDLMSAEYDLHIALARSLGEGIPWADYEAACKAEKLKPMTRRFT
jgi:hypothetical protein